jgi:hypothetical protein
MLNQWRAAPLWPRLPGRTFSAGQIVWLVPRGCTLRVLRALELVWSRTAALFGGLRRAGGSVALSIFRRARPASRTLFEVCVGVVVAHG